MRVKCENGGKVLCLMYKTIKNIILSITKENKSETVTLTTLLSINSEFPSICWTFIFTPLSSRHLRFNIFRSKFHLPFPWDFPSLCPPPPAFPLLVPGIAIHHFFSAGSLRLISYSSLCWIVILAPSNQFACRVDSFSEMPLDSTHHPFGLLLVSCPVQILIVFLLPPIWQQWLIAIMAHYGMFWGLSLWQWLCTQPAGYKINQVFQSFLMWTCASQFAVMIYFSQPKNIPSNKI